MNREHRKAELRLALHRAALLLVAEHGLEQVTVEAIAEAAGLSRRTFSNHFSSKEEALFHHDVVRTEQLLTHLRERPAGENPREALRQATRLLFADATDRDPAWLAQRRALRRHPTLAAHHAAAYAVTERQFAAELAGRLPDDAGRPLRARVLAATFLATLRAATQHWHESPDRPLADVVDEALRQSLKPLSQGASGPGEEHG